MRMKRVLLLGLMVLGLAAPAMAQDSNAVSGISPEVVCGAGECFVPNFTFLGEVVKYTGAGIVSPLRMDIADCCLGGDKYNGQVSSGGFKGTTQTSQVVSSSCVAIGLTGANASINTGSTAAKAQMKITKAGGGFPAGAYIRLSSGSWAQTLGTDQCGF